MASRAGAYEAALDAVSARARAEFREVMARLDMSRPVECKQALMLAVPALVEKYGNLAALAAAEFYGRERVGDDAFRAQAAAPVERGAAQAKLRYALRYLFGGDNGEG